MSSPFIKLQSYPVKSCHNSNIIKISDKEFICAAFKFRESDRNLGLYKYNTISNEWTLISKYPSGDDDHRYYRICYDGTNNSIYLCGGRRQPMTNIDLNTMKIKAHEITQDIGLDPVVLMIQNECHVILGDESEHHYKWNAKSKALDDIFEFSEENFNEGLSDHGVIYIKSQNKLLLFGGTDEEECYDDIWEYDMNSKWSKLDDIKLPLAMSHFTWIMTRNEEYLIIFGGEDIFSERIKNIYILDLNDMIFYSSNIKLNWRWSSTKAISMHDENSIVLISGFIRIISKEYDMVIPSELV